MSGKTQKCKMHDDLIAKSESAYKDIVREAKSALRGAMEPARKRQGAVVSQLLWQSGPVGQDCENDDDDDCSCPSKHVPWLFPGDGRKRGCGSWRARGSAVPGPAIGVVV
ncbi:unnamed protein product [Prorocentrum cordatum]|uniref:Uncharacterized protein n=1 Tax=Prorocentrum cordatum TaxID=2364126 RepID=A0ABN9T9M2_9DINO|nr:unnamed protein product [Polarella glacialis]